MTNQNTALIDRWGGFNVAGATALLNAHVIRKEDVGSNPSLEKIGFVAGVLTLNEEVEVVVKFFDGVHQYTKPEFDQALVVIDG